MPEKNGAVVDYFDSDEVIKFFDIFDEGKRDPMQIALGISGASIFTFSIYFFIKSQNIAGISLLSFAFLSNTIYLWIRYRAKSKRFRKAMDLIPRILHKTKNSNEKILLALILQMILSKGHHREVKEILKESKTEEIKLIRNEVFPIIKDEKLVELYLCYYHALRILS